MNRHVFRVGRFRIATRFGRYRFGFHKTSHHLSGGLGLLWFSIVRRNRKAADR